MSISFVENVNLWSRYCQSPAERTPIAGRENANLYKYGAILLFFIGYFIYIKCLVFYHITFYCLQNTRLYL